MEIHLNFVRRPREWILIKIRTLNLNWHVVPEIKQHLNSHPDWLQRLVERPLENATFNQQRSTTFRPLLRGSQLEYFYSNNQLRIGDTLLYQLDERRQRARERRENQSRRRAINRLRFNHQLDDALEFKDLFLDAFRDIEEHSAKEYLLNFVKPVHLNHFRQFILNASLVQVFEEFIAFYYRNRATRLNDLRNTRLDSGIETYVENRLLYYKLINPLLPLRHHIQKFIEESPNEIKQYFNPDQLPDLLINSKERLISHLNFKINQNNQQQQNPVNQDVQMNVNNLEDELNELANQNGRPNLDD